MHIPLEFYVKVPEELFRLGRKTISKMDYIRTMPPRTEDMKWDVRIYTKNGNEYVDSKSGGLSLFNYRNPTYGTLWWRIPKGTKLPPGLHVSLDKGGEPGKNHYTIRPIQDMLLSQFLRLLKDMEKNTIPCFLGATNSDVG